MMNKNLKLYLDDVRIPIDPEWILVKNYDEFVEVINKNGIDSFSTISLDHDLGDTAMEEYYNNVVQNSYIDYDNIKEKTGLDCAKWLVNQYLEINNPTFKFPKVYTHSANHVGATNISSYINNFLKTINEEESCLRVRIEHYIPDEIKMTLEERHKKWLKEK